PHCGTSTSCQASCAGCVPSGERPSMVVIGTLAAAETGIRHDRMGWPPRWTVQAPHWPMPQPYLVPRSASTSRSTQRRGMSGGTSTVAGCPLTIRVKGIASTSATRLFLFRLLLSARGTWNIRVRSARGIFRAGAVAVVEGVLRAPGAPYELSAGAKARPAAADTLAVFFPPPPHPSPAPTL